jgi:hypothetical protein
LIKIPRAVRFIDGYVFIGAELYYISSRAEVLRCSLKLIEMPRNVAILGFSRFRNGKPSIGILKFWHPCL